MTKSEPSRYDFQPFGAARRLFSERGPEILLAGPAGTGKSRAVLEKIHWCCDKYPGSRWLAVRKTRASFSTTGFVTYTKIVLPPGWVDVNYQGAKYRNGSEIVFGGMDKSSKIMSGEYDGAYVQEATELTEGDWEDITTRLRWGRMPYQQLLADCNPGPPTHWLKKRATSGRLLLLESRHEDNPALWDRKRGTWTPAGARYIAKLDALTGARYLRLRKGIWAAAEGMVFDLYDPAVHLIDRVPLPDWMRPKDSLCPAGIPRSWARIWSVDFGYTNPFVWQAWARDPDGRLYLYHQIYRTQMLVTDHARRMLEVTKGEPRPVAIVCDHDAEDRATLERALGMRTLPAYKAVIPGIQAVQSRFRKAGDGRARIFLLRDSLVDRDIELEESKKPINTEEEIEGYVWNDKVKKEEPVKANDHGCDAMRYLVCLVDDIALDPARIPQMVTYDNNFRISPI
jgi:phage terminase large subunit